MEAKTKLQQYHLQETATSALKKKIQYTEEGEKITRYFYSLERQRQMKQTINVLTKANLDTITETNDIITELMLSTKHYTLRNKMTLTNKTNF